MPERVRTGWRGAVGIPPSRPRAVTLANLDHLAARIQREHPAWGIPLEEARAFVESIDEAADLMEIEAFGHTAFAMRQHQLYKAEPEIEADPVEGSPRFERDEVV